MSAQHAGKRQARQRLLPWLAALTSVSSLTFLYVCWFCSMTGNPIIIVIVVIIIITTLLGTQKLTSGKLRHGDCFVFLVFLVAYFYDKSVFQQMLSPCLL